MDFRKLGKHGLKVSEVSIGGWVTLGGTVEEEERSREIIRRAIEKKINYIDLADVYENGEAERIVGEVIQDYKRSNLVIASKVFWPMSDNPNDRGLSRKHIMESIDASLERLGTDYLDIYYCHRYDEDTPLEETARAMHDLVQQGKILYWGTSVWDPEQLIAARDICRDLNLHSPIVEQPRYNLYDRHIEDRIMATAHELGMGLAVWSPLAQGLLTGKYNEGVPEDSRAAKTDWLEGRLSEENIQRARDFTELAAEAEYEPAQLALAWILDHPEVSSVITGASSPEQVDSNVEAAEIELDDELREEIEELFPREI